ncbi:P2X purinoceptor 7 [Periophthalmus magnuspinnatus]|uniref:P2X purinoceptor 7 n=1 Tax=Periophthalmus magnuspinnatus TaxID=409849 RepID=UPI00145A239E|nr:P2X purinoceptor 7 [Periophthalmus magnuspinnatus]
MRCSCLRGLCQYETTKLVRIQSVRLGSLKWALNGTILVVICMLLLWNRRYQEFELVVSSVTSKVKGMSEVFVPGIGLVSWDTVDYSLPSQDKNSFFVATNLIVTRGQRQGRCAEVPARGRSCRSDKDCEKGVWEKQSHGVQTGACVKFDVLKKTCEISAWCPVETQTSPPRPALVAAAENFTVLIKNNIRFPAFNYIRRNILPWMSESYLRSCERKLDPLCPIFRLGDMVREAGENFHELAVEGGVIAVQIKWDCNLDPLTSRCLPQYSFRRVDQKESNKTLSPGLNYRFARYHLVNGLEERTLYKAFGIRFDVMVFGQAGRFSFIQLVLYIGSTLSYYALTTLFLDWLIDTRCYSAEVGQRYSERKVEAVQDTPIGVLCVSFVDVPLLRLVKRPQKKCLQNAKPVSVQSRKEDPGHLQAVVSLLQCDPEIHPLSNKPSDSSPSAPLTPPPAVPPPALAPPPWCKCSRCTPSSLLVEALCCRVAPGPCISTSGLFERLVLWRTLLESCLQYEDPLGAPSRSARELRHCAYAQYILWRFGPTPSHATPIIPRCCVQIIRERYPSHDGHYSGVRPIGAQQGRGVNKSSQ